MVFPSLRRRSSKLVTNVSTSTRMAAPPPCSNSDLSTSLPSQSNPKKVQPQPKERVRVFLTMLLPPVLASFLFKSTVFLTGGVVLMKGLHSFASTQLSPVVTTLDGPVQGKLAYSRNGSPYWQYLSIPYAQAPVGRLRFQSPVPVKPWKQVRQGFSYPPGCVQFEAFALLWGWGVEDCLFLNVFVPKSDTGRTFKSTPKPVLLYILGGGFVEGQSSFYRPDYIMDKHGENDVIVVTFNYRLGPLGYLNFQEKNDTTGKYPRGNMGLKDQNLAMRWVQRNIARFGGDPGRITCLADSAGAVSLNMHMLSNLSRGLFHRAISVSGSSLSPWGFSKYPRKVAASYASRLGCSKTHDASSLLECYMNMNAYELVSLQYSWSDPLHEKEFSPSLEIHTTPDTFLSVDPVDIFNNGGPIANVPLLTGITSGEGVIRSGRFRAMPELISILDKNWDTAIGNVLFLDDSLPPEVAQELRRYYFGNKSFTNDASSFLDGMTKLTSDALFIGPTIRAGVEHAKRGNPTYFFFYDYRPSLISASFSAFSFSRISDNIIIRWAKLSVGLFFDWLLEYVWDTPGGHSFGVGHAENIFQIWNVNGVTKWLAWPDVEFSSSLIQSIVDFAYDSKPLTYRGLPWPQINNSSFSEYTSNHLPYMRLDNNKIATVIREEPFIGRLQFWEKLRLKYSFNI